MPAPINRLAIAVILSLSISTPTFAQQHPNKSVGKWQAPRTPDGRVDLQGTWTNGTATPFERPPEFAGQSSLTAEQVAALEQRAEDFRTHKSFKATEIGHDSEYFIDANPHVAKTMQTSIVIDPKDGRVPIRPEAERKRDFNLNNYDSYESMSPWDRCITRGPTNLLPANYNNGYQIIQTSAHVVIVAEMIHEARVIPVDGSPHADKRIKSWSGDSRGHWEGDTLIVDTTNFNGAGWITTHSGAGRVRGVPYSESLHIVERFTRVDADTIDYQMTIDDPPMFNKPWTTSIPLTRDDGYQLFEYACHEGNQATESILRGARTQEIAQKTKP